MRVIIQRVLRASVRVRDDSIIVSEINDGVLALIGVEQNDTVEDAEKLAHRIVTARLWPDESTDKPWATSLATGVVTRQLLCVSQFTLHARLKGAKPDFHRSMKAPESERLFERVVSVAQQKLGESRVKKGVFGAYMQVELLNDGPVTLFIDTKQSDETSPQAE